jgi:hypothetical protein
MGLLHQVFVLNNTGAGFAVDPIPIPVGLFPFDVALVDIDADTHLDLVTANAASDDISVSLNDGSRLFGTVVQYPTGRGPVRITFSNVDNSLGLDIITVNFSGKSISVFENQGGGAFVPSPRTYVDRNPSGIAVGDFDGDRHEDLAVCSLNGASVDTLINNLSGIPYAGTTDDFVGKVGISSTPTANFDEYIKSALSGDSLQLSCDSPGGAYVGSQIAVGVQFFLHGFPPVSPLPGLHLNQFGFGATVAIQVQSMPPGGISLSFPIPVGVSGFSLVIQWLGLNPVLAQNGIAAFANAHEVRFL